HILLIVFSTCSIFSQSLSEKIDAYVLSYVKTNDFSGCVLVARNDSILFSGCYGKANFSFDIDNTEGTKFKVGSISKQFTAAAILMLEEKGLLSTNDPITKYFPAKTISNDLTIHHLLTHTSGLVDIYDLQDFYSFPCIGVNSVEIVDMVLDQKPYFNPGERYQYSNGGYVVLARIIEMVSGQAYEDYITNSIFKVLGMNSSGSGGKNEVVKNLAIGYDPYGYSDVIESEDIDYLAKGAGSLHSSCGDLLIWINSLKDRAILSKESYTKFFENYGNNYGYGISVYKSFGKEVFGHDGRITGFIGDYLHYIEDNISIIITGNIQTGVADFFRRDIAAIVFNRDYRTSSKTISPAEDYPINIKSVPGSYSFGPNFTVFVEFMDGRLQARANQGSYSELVPLIDGRYFNRTLYAYINFIEDDTGVIKKMIWENNEGNTFEGMKK
ncbi:MAG: serine hydrolase domain-containing protein, partial [Melioribacteraceae bacterium]|nr:serine hydrolase domain-containing protein [Melioribacteraceae bacterium]